MQLHSKKLYYRIGEVAEIVGVETHVLRYWETEFPTLSPRKNRAGQRVYRPKEIEMLLQIKQLLYVEGFTIAGARKRLARAPAAPPDPSRLSDFERERTAAASLPSHEPARDIPAPGRPPDGAPQKKRPAMGISKVREELENILTLLDRE